MARKTRRPKLAPLDGFPFMRPSDKFSESDVRQLARKFKITEPRAIREMRGHLNWAAGIYEFHRLSALSRPRARQSKATLRQIQKHIAGLRRGLSELDPRTEDLFWLPEIRVESEVALHPGTFRSSYGHWVQQVAIDDETRTYWYITRQRHFESLDILECYSSEALKRLPADKRGQPGDEALRMWAVNIKSYWENTLRRRFSVISHKGEPATDGSAFCVTAFKTVDPTIPATRLLTAMRKVVRRRR